MSSCLPHNHLPSWSSQLCLATDAFHCLLEPFLLESKTALGLSLGCVDIVFAYSFPSLCLFMISKPSFKTDFLLSPWFKYMSRNNEQQEDKWKNIGMTYGNCKWERVFWFQPSSEVPLKKPQSGDPLEHWPFSQQSSRIQACVCIWHGAGAGLVITAQQEWECRSSAAAPSTLKRSLLKSALSVVEMTISRRLSSSFITSLSTDNTAWPIPETCKHMTD